jgi:hypothetical protein
MYNKPLQTSQLSPEEQDAIANWLLKELESETGWDKRFTESQDELCQLAADAIAENRPQGIDSCPYTIKDVS